AEIVHVRREVLVPVQLYHHEDLVLVGPSQGAAVRVATADVRREVGGVHCAAQVHHLGGETVGDLDIDDVGIADPCLEVADVLARGDGGDDRSVDQGDLLRPVVGLRMHGRRLGLRGGGDGQQHRSAVL